MDIENESPVLNFAPKVCFKKKSRDHLGLRIDQVWLIGQWGVGVRGWGLGSGGEVACLTQSGQAALWPEFTPSNNQEFFLKTFPVLSL